MEELSGSTSFEQRPDGSYVVTYGALPKIHDAGDANGLEGLELLRNILTDAVNIRMRLGMRGGLVEGGSVLYGPSLEPFDGVADLDVHLAGEDTPEDAIAWVVDRETLDGFIATLLLRYQPVEADVTWEVVIQRLADEATAAGLNLSRPDLA